MMGQRMKEETNSGNDEKGAHGTFPAESCKYTTGLKKLVHFNDGRESFSLL